MTNNSTETPEQFCDDLFHFLQDSPTAFHATQTMIQRVQDAGFIKLQENKPWQLQQGKSYFVSRDDSAIIAFTIGSEGLSQGFRIVGTHTDSPALKVKPQPQFGPDGTGLLRLGVEVYGGALLHTWFDRDLSLAGRICIQRKNSRYETRLIDFNRPLLTVPNVAIHLNREANKGVEVKKQTQLLPLFAQQRGAVRKQRIQFIDTLKDRLAELYGSEYRECEILSFDLFCYDTQSPQRTGFQREFISASRLDNLLSCHCATEAIISSDKSRNSLIFCSNHEEIGSLSESGADGNFLQSVLSRIYQTTEKLSIGLANSFMISMDNAHATHPSFQEKMDKEHTIKLNRGPVVKCNANQRYTTNAPSIAIFKRICADADIAPQFFVMNSDMPCGSTIGPMTSAKLGIRSLDIGAASFAMHSIREMTGFMDPWLCFRGVLKFFDGNYHL